MRKNTSMALRGRMGISDLKQYLTKIAVLHHPSPQTHHPPKTTDSQCIRLVEPMKPDCVSALQRKRLESWPEELRARLSPARFEKQELRNLRPFPANSRAIQAGFSALQTVRWSRQSGANSSPPQ